MDTLLKQASRLLEEHKWEVRVEQDLEFIADKIDQSAIKVFDAESGNRIRSLLESVKKMPERLTQEHYLFIMQIANVLIGDDHSFINLQSFGERQEVKYGGFVASYIDQRVVVMHSRTPSIPRWSVIKKVNGMPVKKWLSNYISYASPKTENPEVNLRRASAFLCIFNPFNPVSTLSIETPEGATDEIVVEYITAKRLLFVDKKIPKLSAESLHSLMHKLIYVRIDETPLQTISIKDANMLYFHMHGFPNMDKSLHQLINNMMHIREKEYKWIVFDMRNNFGGSLSALNAAVHFLYGDAFIKHFNKSMSYNFAVSKDFIEEYYDEVILPVIADEDASKPVKRYFDQFMKQFEKRKGGIYTEPGKRSTSRDFLAALEQQVAQRIIKKKTDKIVILVTDSHCYSACTWTAHILRRIPNVVLVGKHISATRESGNALRFDLPSLMGSLAIPELFVEVKNKGIEETLAETQEPDIYIPDSVIASTNRLLIFLLENTEEFKQICIKKAVSLSSLDQ